MGCKKSKPEELIPPLKQETVLSTKQDDAAQQKIEKKVEQEIAIEKRVFDWNQNEEQYKKFCALPQENQSQFHLFICSTEAYAQLTTNFQIPLLIGLTTYQEIIYVAGGTFDIEKQECLKTAKKVSLSGEGLDMPELNTERVGSSLIIAGYYLFVVGGHNFKNSLKEVECISLSSFERFSKCAPLLEPRAFCTLFVKEKQIYALGGSDLQADNCFKNSSEIYDPEEDR